MIKSVSLVTCVCFTVPVFAQTAEPLQTVVVVGSHIEGAQATQTLPVSVLTADQIAATGSVTGEEVMRAIPQMGDVTFNPSNDPQTSNAARGDVSSIDLRGAGLGDTLVLLNGRRVVEHPTSQSRGGVPLISYNAQALPVAGVQRVEVLRQGAAAIYGADAVAGVVNVMTQTGIDDLSATVQYGFAEGTHRKETTASLVAGRGFDAQRGNVSLIFRAYHREAQRPSDEPYTASQDLRSAFSGNPGFSTSAAPDGRSNQSSFPALVARTISSAVLQGNVPLTTAAGSFHVQPSSLSGCATQIGSGLCIGRGSVPYSTVANVLRYDARANDAVTIAPEISRQNATFTAHYDLNDAVTAYTEVDYYHATSEGLTTQPTALVPIGVPASNYYNPFGSVSRLPNLTNVPASGLPVSFATYRFNDLGPAHVDVASEQSRVIVGARGLLGGFRYDSALLYGEGRVRDLSDGIDSALLAQQLALSTPDAYNPFNGGCLDGSGGSDCSPSSQAALDAIRIRLKRTSISRLLNVDFRLSRADLARLPAGQVSLAVGVEGRRESHSDFRDPRVSGALPFTDPVLKTVSASSAVGVNNTPSTSDSRYVGALFSELAIPLVRTVNMQLAARAEHYSDFGSVVKPRVALGWEPVSGLRLRASWEQGFKAPNLETTSSYTYARAQTVTDWYRCQAALNKGRIATFNACNENFGISYTESGNPELRPENTHSYNLGLVFGRGPFTFSVDRWRLHQNGIVGVAGFDTIAVQDYFNRLSGGAGSPNLARNAPTADDVAFYAGSGLQAVGSPVVASDRFMNLQPKTTSGVDVALGWRMATAALGRFDASLDATHLDKLTQLPSPELQVLYDGRASGIINAATPLADPGNRLGIRGNPKWKATASLTWSYSNLQIGSSVFYTGTTFDTDFLSTTGEAWRVASLTTVNVYGQYQFRHVKWRAGARNLFDRSPPLQSDGFNGALYVPYGRYLYLSIGASL